MGGKRIAGKIVGSVLGFMLGGPVGAVFGFIIGHLRDIKPRIDVIRSEIYSRTMDGLYFFQLEEELRRARSSMRQPEAATRDDSYEILGLKESATDAEIKSAYRALIRKHHPDKLASEGLPPALIAEATEKMKQINAAYAVICKGRGIK